MSILSNNSKITPKWLRANGWEKDGWGSIRWRKEHNATVWCKIYTFEDNDGLDRTVEVIWFPKDFDGYVVGFGFNMKGMVLFLTSASPKRNPVSKCEDIYDLTTFISNIIKRLKKDFYKYV